MVWAAVEAPPELGPVPRVGDRVRLPELGATLRAIASEGPDAFYSGRIGSAIAAASWLTEDDLGRFEPRWVDPLRGTYRDLEVYELPPPTQGVCALEALGLLEGLEPDPPEQGLVGPAGARGRTGARS